ncbi:serine/arginine repetitive matrix protein 1-like isoform X3 [Mytilus trossulus]|uniref:serine/arginine repetitive matrix protein 1-like isoform X3 n=1 Tax=Mytilus trossulus TaxID=6551 RepID=UPI0030055540
MPSPRRRSRDRRSRSRSRSPYRRPPPRRSKSRSPRRRPPPRCSRSRSRTPPRRLSPRRSRTHSPARRPLRRSRSRNRSISPRRRGSPLPRVRPPVRRSPSPRRRPLGPRSLSPRSRPVRRSPKRTGTGQVNSHLEKDRRRQSPHSSTDLRGRRSQSPVLSPRNSSHHAPRERSISPSPKKAAPPKIRHKTDFISAIIVATPIRRQLLSDRFITDDQKHQGDIVVEDNIVIAIQRGPHAMHASPMEISREFDSNNVIVHRRKDEGKKSIFDREEIKIFGFDNILDENVYEEKRIISVVPSASHSSSKRRHSPEVIRKFKHGPEIKLNFRPDPKYESLVKEEDHDRIKRVEKNPNDLRHSLSKRKQDEDPSFDARKKIDAKRKSTDGSRKDSNRVFDRIGGRQRERKKDGSRERKPERSTSGRDRDSKRPDGEKPNQEQRLPDFKNRPDKFRYEEWKENPELIPRNPSYFEHDNREGQRGFRGRGRGFRGRTPFRGRGRGFRGSSRGFSNSSRDNRDNRDSRDTRDSYKERESTWKHDLFDKIKDEDEKEKPSSTTEN